MELYPLLLVMLSAVLHLGWNTITKKADNKFITLWLMVVSQAVIGGCAALIFYDLTTLPAISWFFMALSGSVHGFYYWFLTKAYSASDLSFVYPYTRGFGALIAVIGGIVLLNEIPSMLGGIGVFVIIATILLEPLLSNGTKEICSAKRKEILFVSLTALTIGSYLLIDTFGVRTTPPWIYLVGMKIVSAIVLLPLALRQTDLKTAIKKSTKPALLGSGFAFSSYTLTLMAMAIAPIAYVASARALGIVVSGLVGFFILKEHLKIPRILSIVLISLGILLIGLG